MAGRRRGWVVVAGQEGFHGRKRNPLGRGTMRWLAETPRHRRAGRSQPGAPTFGAPLVVGEEGDLLAGCHLDAKISRGATTPTPDPDKPIIASGHFSGNPFEDASASTQTTTSTDPSKS